jgi:hypothetical protein
MPLTLQQLSFDAHLRDERHELFHHRDTSYTRAHRRSRDDIVRDIQRHGFDTSQADIIDDFAYAETVLEFTATADGDLFVPSGTRVRVQDISLEGQTHGVVVFETNEDATALAGESILVEASAEFPGTPYNVDADALLFPEDTAIENLAEVTNPAPAFGGVDHQLTRAAVYRSLAIVYMDLMRMDDDAFASAFKRYQKAYAEEVKRVVAAGVKMTGIFEKKTHGMKRFERG